MIDIPKATFDLNADAVAKATNEIINSISVSSYNEVYKKSFSCIDLTTLSANDTHRKVADMCTKVSAFNSHYPDIPNVGAVCIYPALVEVAAANLTNKEIGIASVAAGFPASQTFISIKNTETEMAVQAGATEIDVVISVGKFIEEKYDEVFEEIKELKQACGNAKLKVILETGALQSPELIHKASHIAMQAGADFIKTSTGKEYPGASLEAAYVMTNAIKEYQSATGRKIGFKPAGGISDAETALKYYAIVDKVLGEEWLSPKLFRIGASRLANNLLSALHGEELKYF